MPVDQSYRLIPLTQGQFAKIDVCNYDLLSQFSWQARWNSKTRSFYAIRDNCYGHWRRDRETVMMHRQIMGLVRRDGKICDHVNHDTLDNRLQNLRVVTNSQNLMNRRLNRNSSLGLKGVTMHSGGYRGQINCLGRHIVSPVYPTPKQARKWYVEMAKRIHGEFYCEG